MTTTRRRIAHFSAAGILGVTATLIAAAPAAAHTGVTVQPARAGAENALATANAEAESDSAGVTKVQIFLPQGIAPGDITLESAPKGWKLTTDADSYTVAGPALAVGKDAQHKVRIRQLPTSATISFRVLQTYDDGRTDRWIEIPSKANPEPENPAPTVKLAGGSDTPPSAAPTSAAPSPSAAATASAPAPAPTSAATALDPVSDEAGSSLAWLWWVLAVLLVAGAGAAIAIRQRRKSA
ncbi:DUF1775 domain-containing protein [Spirilliplanes yamanashiensis]|uniref:YncI copper-binding domain-containing protein n=1 Tax=Spirilliplanes yamanashiensis TaxID=42233 RepID=A0A8J3YEI7_9ACTN|nr:DUF1775 domain-containing protein [Spirilliplanes yamanashiensis]MDP9818397.1 uncharacterized protein YcnI [Spirilliplanes yamanashiensis]GIJ06619.1 hypothetical protein Sya03_59710 [Spirilliplanes yamanashiensis]